ncbi:MAG: hypothetical protein ACI4I8_01840, partial [Oscillospiraceae bacterium]
MAGEAGEAGLLQTGGLFDGERARPKQRWAEEGLVTPQEGSAAWEEAQTAQKYGIPCFVGSQQVYDANHKNAEAFSYGGQIYLREELDPACRGMYVEHETIHVMQQSGYEPYLYFLSSVVPSLNRKGNYYADFIRGISKHCGLDYNNIEEWSSNDYLSFADEICAVVYGSYAAQDTAGLDLIRDTFYDLDGFLEKLDGLKRDFLEERLAQAQKREALTGRVTFAFERAGRSYSETQATGIKTLEQLSAALGISFYVYESYLNEDGIRVYRDRNGVERAAPNGWFDLDSDVIAVDIHAGLTGQGTVLYTAAHELTHFIQKWSPAKYKALADFLVAEYGKSGQSVNDLVLAQIAKAKRAGRNLSYDEGFAEMVADSMET